MEGGTRRTAKATATATSSEGPIRQQEHQQQKFHHHHQPISHCEIAVGTGMFLTELLEGRQQEWTADAPSPVVLPQASITLIDLNPNTLDGCERRLKDAMARSSSTEKEGRLTMLPPKRVVLVGTMRPVVLPRKRRRLSLTKRNWCQPPP
jgi:hypothetical protein